MLDQHGSSIMNSQDFPEAFPDAGPQPMATHSPARRCFEQQLGLLEASCFGQPALALAAPGSLGSA